MIRVGIFLVLLMTGCRAIAQHTVDFQIPTEVCLNELVPISNLSDMGTSVKWDFCASQLDGAYSSFSIGVLTPFITDLAIVDDAGQWFGFATSRSGYLIRMRFGDSPYNLPINIENLGNLGNLLDKPEAISILKVDNKWYGFIANKNELIRLDWGPSLTSVPLALSLNLSPSNKLNIPVEIELVKSGNDFIAILANSGTGTIALVNFGPDITSVPNSTNILLSAVLPDASDLSSVTITKICNQWFLYAIATNKIYKIDVGTDLFTTLPVEKMTEFSAFIPKTIGQFNRLESIVYGSKTYVYFTSFTGQYLNAIVWDYGETSPQFMDLGSQPTPSNPYVLESFYYANRFGFILSGFIDGQTRRIEAVSPCGANTQFNFEENPIAILYSQPGTFEITVSVDFNDGVKCSKTRSIIVRGTEAPSIAIAYDNICLGALTTFTVVSSQQLKSTSWAYGDGNSNSSGTHTYLNSGSYQTKADIVSINDCHNFILNEIKIYSPPTTNFSQPSGLICTNNQFTFTNNTIDNFDGNLIYQWYVDNTPLATTRNFNYSFPTTGNKDVKLKTSIPGCTSEQTQTVSNVLPGPVVDFAIAGKCENENILFANNSSGSITGYSWDFGNSQTSTLLNPTQNYSKGSYMVSLQATASNGCISSTSKNLTIYSTPQPDFSIGLPPFSCAGSASQFTDVTPSPTDSNITNWTWGFGDAANGSSLVKNPSYTYATANTYNVSLAVATNFGCTNSIQKVVTISPSPVAGFSNLPACVNQATQFTDASSGSIKSRLWQIQSSTFTTPNPQFIFPSAGSFPVVLTVTGNNNCVSQASKNIVVPVVPSLDFSVQAPCANSPTVFTELTTSVDPSISKSWSFGSQGTGSGSPVQYTFSSTGTYVVQLNSTRQSGCVYSVSKNVSIVTPPVADFVPSIDAGAVPLPVSFTNNSSGANSYLWKFGDPGNSTSVLISPTFVFSELGSYNVELSASNSVGCTNRLSKPISVVIPNVDAEMTDFFFVKEPKTGSLQPVVKLLNRSNITLTNPIILLDVAGGSGVSQQLTGIIKPNQEISQMLDLKLVPKTNQYVCAEVVVVGDTDTFLNRRCLSLSGEEVLFAPFPNPAREQLNMDWISIDGSAVTFQVLTSAGAASFQQTISSINPGLNRLVINTSTLLSGTYFIRFRDRTNDRTFSLVVLGN